MYLGIMVQLPGNTLPEDLIKRIKELLLAELNPDFVSDIEVEIVESTSPG
jgi:hypothetical protein